MIELLDQIISEGKDPISVINEMVLKRKQDIKFSKMIKRCWEISSSIVAPNISNGSCLTDDQRYQHMKNMDIAKNKNLDDLKDHGFNDNHINELKSLIE